MGNVAAGPLAYSFNLMSKLNRTLGRLVAVCLTISSMLASEHRGVVKSGGMPIPGATVTATKGDKKVTTTTDDQGAYTFSNLEDGVWNVEVDMLGFGKRTLEIGVAPNAPAALWDLKVLTPAELKAALAAPAAAPTPTTTAAAAPKPAESPKETPKPPAETAAAQRPSIRNAQAQAQNGGRGAAGRGQASGRGGNGQGQNGSGFQRLDVNTADPSAAAGSDFGATADSSISADMSQSANDALAIGGSVSSGLGMPQENDWGGRGPGEFGGPGMFGMMGGPGGLNGDGQQLGGEMGGRGGRGGPGGPGGPGGMMAGGPGGGGPGGGFGGRGGFGGPGGRGFGGPGGPGGRGGRPGAGGRNANAFGNGRRNARMRYNGNLAIIEQNSALNAQQYSLTGQNTPKPSTQNARVTAMFGGPLKIPHLLSGQKTTFTLNYQFARSRTGNTLTSLVPTTAERAGDFSQAYDQQGKAVTIYDPQTGNPFPGNIIPSNRISSQALGLLQYYPLPNFAATGLNALRYNYQTATVGNNNQDNVNTRISHTLNTKNQFSGNFSYQRADGTNVNLFGFNTGNHQSAYNTGVNWTYHFTNRLINSMGVNFSRNTQSNDPYFANRINVSGQLGIAGNDQDPNFWGPPSLGFANGFAGLSDQSTALNRAQTIALTDSIRWFRGTHNFTFGGDLRRVQNNPLTQQNPRGSFTFTGGVTSLNGVGGFDLADFLLGLPDTSNIAYGNADKYFRSTWSSLYFTDDWRITTKFSLNAGLRWDYQTPTTELYGRIVNLNIGPGFTTASPVCATTAAGCAAASQVGYPDGLVHSNPREFQPRIGYAWRPLNKGTLVIRGGYGIYYNTSVYQSLVSQMSQQSPFSYSLIDATSAASPLTLANGFPIQTLSPITTFAVDPNFHIGYAQSWQMSVQQNLFWSMVGTATYSGAKGTHQAQEFIPNSAPPKATPDCPTCPTNFYYMTSGGNTIANNFILNLNRRFRSGFMSNVSYIHVNSIDSGAAGGGGRGGAAGAATFVAQDWQNLEAERARTSGIRADTLNVMMQYSTGVGGRGAATLMNGVKGKLLRDWTIQTNFSVASGAPETPSVANRALGGTGIVGPLRAFYTGAPVFLSDGVLNPAAFISPVGVYGNAGRNIITGPSMFSLNASFSRTIRLGERRSADFRIDAQNALNHVTFGSYNTSVGSTQFGLLQAPGRMRAVTANLRFRF